MRVLGLLASFCVAGYAATKFVPLNPVGVAVWFVGAVAGHDLMLVPLYGAADRGLRALLPRRRPGRRPPGPWLNHVRVPAVLAGLTLLVFFPLILRLPHGFAGITGRSITPYLWRWLLVTGVLFGGSAALLALRSGLTRSGRRARRRAVGPGSPAGQDEVLD